MLYHVNKRPSPPSVKTSDKPSPLKSPNRSRPESYQAFSFVSRVSHVPSILPRKNVKCLRAFFRHAALFDHTRKMRSTVPFLSKSTVWTLALHEYPSSASMVDPVNSNPSGFHKCNVHVDNNDTLPWSSHWINEGTPSGVTAARCTDPPELRNPLGVGSTMGNGRAKPVSCSSNVPSALGNNTTWLLRLPYTSCNKRLGFPRYEME